MIAKLRFQGWEARVDQIVADVAVRTRVLVCCRCEVDGCLGDLEFVCSRPLTDSLDDVTVTITRCEFHAGVDARRVFAQQRLDQADFLEEVVPVERREQAHAGDDVPDCDLRSRLSLVFGMDDLFDARALLRELLLDPIHHRHH